MATTVSELQVVVSADTSKAESGLSALGGKLGSVGAGIATAFGGAAIAGIAAVGGALVASTTAAAGFDQTMASIRSKLTAAEWNAQGAAIQETAMRLGKDYPLSASEAGKAIDLLVQKGVKVTDINAGWAESVVKLSTATGSDLVTASGIAAAASDAFNIKADQSGEVVNKITGAVIKGGMSIEDFGYGFQSAGAVIALAGGSIDDVTLGLAAMARRGIEGSDAGTSLKTMYMNLIPTTKAQIKVAKELGIITADGTNRFFDASGKAKDYAAISKVLAEATDGLTKKQTLMALETLFGSDAIRAAGISAEFGRGEIDELKASIDSVDAGEVAKKRIDNLKGSLEQFWGTAETAGIKLGQGLLPGLKDLVEWGTDGLDDLTPTIEAVGASIGGALSEGVKTAKDLFRQLADAYRTVIQVFEYDWEPSDDIESLAAAAGNAAVTIRDLFRQLADAYRTVIQVFEYDWEPSDDIESLAAAAGNAAVTIRDLYKWLQSVGDAAADMGAWDNFASGLETIRTEAELARGNLDRIGEALGRLDALAGGADTKINVLAAGIKVVGVAFELWATSIGQVVDTLTSLARGALNVIALVGNIGRAMAAVATGDMAAYDAAAQAATAAFLDLIGTHNELSTRTAERTQQAFSAMTTSTTANMEATSAAVEAGMAASVAAVEASAPQMEAAAQTAGQGVATGIESAAPAMAAAAESGASQAVAAVEGQTGAASAAGSSVGANLGDGLISGIQSKIGGIIAAARSMVSAALGAANDEAIIESPSKKTMYMGQMLDEGLVKGIQAGGPAVQAAFRDVMGALTDYVPVAKEIARVEDEIKGIRDKAQTDALFRAKEMVTIDSESLRLKQAQVRLERDLIPLRQDLARATREVSDIERGSLTDRTNLIEMDGKRKALRLEQITLEKELVGLDADSKRAASIQKQIDRLRDQDRLLALEAERISVTNSVASTNARIRKEALDDQARGQDAVVQLIKDQIEVLQGEQAVFQANENVIKNATENEIAYRNQLIAVFKSEAAPLQARITAGLALIDQLEAEGKIGEEVAKAWREVVKQQQDVKASTAGVASASAAAAPAISAAAQQAEEAAKAYQRMAEKVEDASGEVSVLAKSLGKLPEWFIPKGGSSLGSVLFPPGRAAGGDVKSGTTYLVGERGPELFTPSTSGTIVPNNLLAPAPSTGSSGGVETLRLDVAIGGKVAEQIVIQGYDLAVKRGWTPAGLTG